MVTRPRSVRWVALAALCVSLHLPAPAAAQKPKVTADLKAPEPGYVYPPGGKAGTTVDVRLGGYDWTPDVQLFVLDPRVKLEAAGELGPVLVPPPPYWFGAKSTLPPPPLPRERPAKLTLPAGLPPGPVLWAVASASGAGARTGVFWVGAEPEVAEDGAATGPQKLPALPVTVNGRLSRIEEVDRYRFAVATDGPVTCDLFARRLGVNVNAALAVRDDRGRVVADAVDTEGRDLAVTFAAAAGREYTVSVNDLDYRGDASFVYRLALRAGPRVVATVPAAGRRGETRRVEFVGYGVATGAPKLEAVARDVAFPADPAAAAHHYRLETPFGAAPVFDIPLSDMAETVAGATPALTMPAAVTGVLDGPAAEARFTVAGKKGDVWELEAGARRFGSPLDLTLAVVDAAGKELARNDDLPGTTDAGLTFPVPADGVYTVVVADQSGRAGTRAAVYRLTARRAAPDFALATAARVNVPLGGTAQLVVKADRRGGMKEPIALAVAGLPEGVTAPAGLVIPADKAELAVPLTGASTAPSAAALVTVTGTAGPLVRPALAAIPGSLAARSPDEERTPLVVLAPTLPPRLKVTAVEADGGRKVHRGSTHPAEVTLERFDGFRGDVSLQMSAAQSYQRQGITGPDLVVPAGADRAFYPCFMPEWLETTRTSRMELIGVIQVPDAKGRVRHLATPMVGRITMSIEGAILKVSADAKERTVEPGGAVAVPVAVLRSAKLAEPVRLELVVPERLAGAVRAEPVTVAAGQSAATVTIACSKDAKFDGVATVTIRGTALQGGKYAVVSEAAVTIERAAK